MDEISPPIPCSKSGCKSFSSGRCDPCVHLPGVEIEITGELVTSPYMRKPSRIRNPQTLANHTGAPKTRPSNFPVSLFPVKVKPFPPKLPTPVVGSSTWVDTKNGPPVNTHKALTGACVNAGMKTPPRLAWKNLTSSAISSGGGRRMRMYVNFEGVKPGPGKPNTPATPDPTQPHPLPPESPSRLTTPGGPPNPQLLPLQPTPKPTQSNGDVMISLSPSQEKNLYGLLSIENEDDLTDLDMQLAYVVRWGKTAIAASSTGNLWGRYAGASGGGQLGTRKPGARRPSQLWTHEPRPYRRPTDVSQPWKLRKKEICSGMSRPVREEERKKREAWVVGNAQELDEPKLLY
ncbi:uncharacterized protein LACBIDRAFT_331517 [Laccaria bicolor S238N-H82]|uniref:Predicted protein n=1 Tax=Laccaria bicolor (strain S238N-H82 / ATCC MYA-4686) TaxID=486041 RepID=B0DPQ2_LACBS|nr:uncharacterized protein LACBIDRAFT_331517 [Laccaria bicolor S238N-H82]EDR03418.1 predicted protein [Laccaria bicolor S238N-H82]|eukprot:XP_001885874.1 predicted protein [Laccaria bicolor S238N-H82]